MDSTLVVQLPSRDGRVITASPIANLNLIMSTTVENENEPNLAHRQYKITVRHLMKIDVQRVGPPCPIFGDEKTCLLQAGEDVPEWLPAKKLDELIRNMSTMDRPNQFVIGCNEKIDELVREMLLEAVGIDADKMNANRDAGRVAKQAMRIAADLQLHTPDWHKEKRSVFVSAAGLLRSHCEDYAAELLRLKGAGRFDGIQEKYAGWMWTLRLTQISARFFSEAYEGHWFV